MKFKTKLLLSSNKRNAPLVDIGLVDSAVNLRLEQEILACTVAIDGQDDVALLHLGLPDQRGDLGLGFNVIAQLDTMIAGGRGATDANAFDTKAALDAAPLQVELKILK